MIEELEEIDEKEEYRILHSSTGWKLLMSEIEKKRKNIVTKIVKECENMEEIIKLRSELDAYNYIENLVNEKVAR